MSKLLTSSRQLTDLLVKSKAGDFAATLALSDYASNLTPKLAMSEEHAQISVLRKTDPSSYLKTIGLLILRLNGQFNVARPMNTEQIADLTARIGKKFYYLRLAELFYVFDQAVSGRYGPAYQSLDSETVMSWIEKYDVTERTPVAIAVSSERAEQKQGKLSDSEYGDFLQRVADGHKTHVEAAKRISDDWRTAQNEARARYVREKAAGLVKDYSNEDQPDSDHETVP